jgi:hypothetical protein
MRTAIAALFAAGLAALPISAAKAQYYCDPNPLAWPFCIAGAAIGTAASIATAPLYVLGGRPYYYNYGYPYPYYYGQPYYYRAGYYYPGRRYYKKPRRVYHRRY